MSWTVASAAVCASVPAFKCRRPFGSFLTNTELELRVSPWRHLNKLRWVSLTLVFLMLILLPCIHVYQNLVAAHAYDLLPASDKTFYDVMERITDPFVTDPAKNLDKIKGTTWSGTFFGLRLSDPLAVVSQSAAALSVYWPFVVTALIPIALTLIFGRFFCGWLCPAAFLYELADKSATWLRKTGFPFAGDGKNFNPRFKYLVLAVSVIASAVLGTAVLAAIYPPAVVGRELYYTIAYSGAGVGGVYFLVTLLFDLLVIRRGFCRFLCPGGALYSLLGHYRLVRIQRKVEACDDCTLCNLECQYGLDPKRDGFGQECNNCSACIAVCPKDALAFTVRLRDAPYAGPGHLGAAYRRQRDKNATTKEGAA
ncbi:MAG: 4Fe-4S binding protein [Alphaproteobacteria bacterium]|nr:4Fe-4S binding protein [Alphaproteobacteria bacterium]